MRQSAQRRAGASSDISDNYVSDTDKICMQLFLDIQVGMMLSLFCGIIHMQIMQCIVMISEWIFNSLSSKLCLLSFDNLPLAYCHQEYGRNLSALGVEAVNIASYRSLWQCVAPVDKKNSINL